MFFDIIYRLKPIRLGFVVVVEARNTCTRSIISYGINLHMI